MQKINKKDKFTDIFFKIIIIVLIVLSLISLSLSLILNENFFLKYSKDKKLESETIARITNLRITLLSLEAFFLFLILIFVCFNFSIKRFIYKHKVPIQNILLLFAVIIFLFLISEISLRIYFYDKTTSFDFGPALRFNNKYVKLNNEGFRDINHEIEKPNGTIRILGLGDSYTFAFGIKNIEDSYLEVLEKKLNKDKNYEIFNFGIPGGDIYDELLALKEKGLKYKPDIIIISYSPNDYVNIDSSIKNFSFWQEIRVPFNFWLKNYFYTYFFLGIYYNKFLENIGKKQTYQDFLIEVSNSEVNEEYSREILKEIKNIAEESQIKVLVIAFPILYNFKNYPFSQAHNFIKDAAEKNNFYFLDLLALCEKYDEKELIVNKYDRHPNELGHRLAGEAIYEKLSYENLIP